MRVAMISRATLHTSAGGDTTQIMETAAALRSLGVTVDVLLTTDQIEYAQYDLLHFFNIIRPADIISHVVRSGKPFLVSTIFLEFGVYGRDEGKGIAAKLSGVLGEDRMEYVKAIARHIRNGERIMSRQYIFRGHRQSVKWILRRAAMLLPNSQSEYTRLVARYKIERPYRVVPNGIGKDFIKQAAVKRVTPKETVLCVARIEGRKNQLNLIRALRDTGYWLLIQGKASPNHAAYYAACKAEAGSNVAFSGWLSGQALYDRYHAAKVHVLASYFETTGLSSLEAAALGCNIVITDKGDTTDYFGDRAWYCNPDDPASIRAAVEAAYAAPYNEEFRQYILKHYTWQKAAEETLAAYRQVAGI